MASIIINNKANGKEYKLEYNRNALIRMEEMGFNAKSANDKPIASMTYLIRGAFIMHHSDLSYDEIDKITAQIDNISGLVEELAKMYSDAMQSIIAVDKSKEPKNITWGKA